MNLVDYCIKHIRRRIPERLLKRAFKSDNLYGRHNVVNLNWLIEQDVIRDQIIPDLNASGGQHVTLELTGLTPQAVDGGYVYEIPIGMSQGRHISRVLSVDQTRSTADYSTKANPLMRAADRMGQASVGFEATGDADVRMVAPNTIITHQTLSGLVHLRCVLGYDEMLSTVNRAHWRQFANLAVIAAEGVIYNRVRHEMDSGSGTGGAPNGALISRLDQMEDAWERYEELMEEKIVKLSIFADHDAYLDHLRFPLGGFH